MSGRKHIELHNILSSSVKENENGKILVYKIKFTRSVKFLASSLLRYTNNLAEGLHKNKCKYCKSCLEHMWVKAVSRIQICRPKRKNIRVWQEFRKKI